MAEDITGEEHSSVAEMTSRASQTNALSRRLSPTGIRRLTEAPSKPIS